MRPVKYDLSSLQRLITEAAVGEAGRQCPERWLVPLQAAIRGLLVRRRLTPPPLQRLITEAALGEAGRQCPERWLVPLQAAIRGLLVRRRLRERQQLFRRHERHIVCIQVRLCVTRTRA